MPAAGGFVLVVFLVAIVIPHLAVLRLHQWVPAPMNAAAFTTAILVPGGILVMDQHTIREISA